MIRRLSVLASLLLLASPLAGQTPAGLQLRVDKSTSAEDPDDRPDVTITGGTSAFTVNTCPAAVVWNPANTATGAYTLRGTFTLQKPSGHNNYYGLVYGGRDLQGAGQQYIYFLVAQNGTFLVKHRAGETVMDLVGRTPHASIVTPGTDGTSVNQLEVRVAADKVDYVVNGTVIHSGPRTGMQADTDGVYGVRINHVIPGVLVEGLSVTK